MRHVLLGVALVLAMSTASSPARVEAKQSTSHAVHMNGAAGSKFNLRIKIDGRVTPSAISDDDAYTYFFHALASRSDRQAKRLDAVLKQAGLDDEDRRSFAGTISQLTGVAPTSGIPLVSAQQRARDRAAAKAVRQQLTNTLSSRGSARLDEYVRTQVKRHIVIYGE